MSGRMPEDPPTDEEGEEALRAMECTARDSTGCVFGTSSRESGSLVIAGLPVTESAADVLAPRHLSPDDVAEADLRPAISSLLVNRDLAMVTMKMFRKELAVYMDWVSAAWVLNGIHYCAIT